MVLGCSIRLKKGLVAFKVLLDIGKTGEDRILRLRFEEGDTG
jgi:hypothetical protein